VDEEELGSMLSAVEVGGVNGIVGIHLMIAFLLVGCVGGGIQ
jgi:hypothetical protein